MNRLAGKVCVITGGSGGIGLATGRLFAAEGATVVLVDLNAGRLQAAVAEAGSAAIHHQVADVSDEAQMRAALHDTVARHGRLDVLFCNAGTEGRIAYARQYYNDAARTVNQLVRTLPWMLFAGVAGVSERPFYEAPAGQENPPKVEF